MAAETPKRVPSVPAALLLLQDIVFLGLAGLAHGVGVLAALQVVAWLAMAGVWWPLALPVVLFVYPLGMLLVVMVVDRLVPHAAPGRHPMGGTAFVLWGLHLVLYRVARLQPAALLIRYVNLLRWIWLRGLGTNAAFTAQLSGDVNLLDHRPVTLGHACVVGAEALLSTHLVLKGQLLVAPITVGEGALVGARCGLAPGATVGPRAMLQVGVAVGLDAVVEADARVGGYCTLDSGSRVGAGAILEARSHLTPGMVVPAGERWGGIPARKIAPDTGQAG